jgi:hypothetical protein
MSEPLDPKDWWIVIHEGLFFVGTKNPGKVLKNLHRLEMPMVPTQTPDGRGIMPVIVKAVYPWIVDELPLDGVWIAVQATNDPNGLMAAIENSEKLKLVARAQKSNIHLVGH